MRHPLVRLALLALVAAGSARSLAAQNRLPAPGTMSRELGTIDGVVSDTGLAPIQAAFVSILGTKIRVGTGPNGRFRITKVPAGQYLVIVKRVGYRPTSSAVEVMAGDTLRLAYTLDRAAEVLSPVIVSERSPSSKLLDFEKRRRLGVGEFMTEEEIKARNSVYSTELFRKFMSINVSPSRTTSITQYFALSGREGGNPGVGACPMQIYVDQVPLPTPFNLDLLPAPREIAGIEVYAGSSTVPPQFAGPNRGCGVILVWTKDG